MEETVSIKGYEFKVDFDYQPYERPTRHYPGCSENVDINNVWDSDGDEVKEYVFDYIEEDLRIACLERVREIQDLAIVEEGIQGKMEERKCYRRYVTTTATEKTSR